MLCIFCNSSGEIFPCIAKSLILSSLKFSDILFDNNSKLSLFATKPEDISSVSADNLSGASIESTAPNTAKIRDIIINTFCVFNSFTNLKIAPLRSLAFSPRAPPIPGPIWPFLLGGVFKFFSSLSIF